MSILVFDRNSGAKLDEYGGTNFVSSEFDCNCSVFNCKKTRISEDLIKLLQKIRDHFGKPVKINSAYRCVAHNKKVGGKPNSQHLLGIAADICIDGVKPIDIYNYVNSIHEGGVGIYDTFVHVDVRDGRARWDERKKTK